VHFVEVRNAVLEDDPLTVDDLRGENARVHGQFLAWEDDRVVGAARATITEERDHPWAHLFVLPSERGCGVGSQLYAAISAWARGRNAKGFEVWIGDEDEPSREFAERRDFVETSREHSLALDLTRIEAPVVEPPPGIELTTWAERPETIRGIYEVAREALPDVPGEEELVVQRYENWLAHEMEGPGDRADATFVALAGAEVVGYAKFAFAAAQPSIAHHDLTGVKRAWRGRGIAAALKVAQIRWAQDSGFTELRTNNEERNAPISKLNERYGYRRRAGRIYLRGPLA
jgi:GNAT superfamily N-acetyltransferase